SARAIDVPCGTNIGFPSLDCERDERDAGWATRPTRHCNANVRAPAIIENAPSVPEDHRTIWVICQAVTNRPMPLSRAELIPGWESLKEFLSIRLSAWTYWRAQPERTLKSDRCVIAVEMEVWARRICASAYVERRSVPLDRSA